MTPPIQWPGLFTLSWPLPGDPFMNTMIGAPDQIRGGDPIGYALAAIRASRSSSIPLDPSSPAFWQTAAGAPTPPAQAAGMLPSIQDVKSNLAGYGLSLGAVVAAILVLLMGLYFLVRD